MNIKGKSTQELQELKNAIGREALEALGLWQEISTKIDEAIAENQYNKSRADVLKAAKQFEDIDAPTGASLIVKWEEDGTTTVTFKPGSASGKSKSDRTGRHVVLDGKIWEDPIFLVEKLHPNWFKNASAFSKADRYTQEASSNLTKYGPTTWVKRYSEIGDSVVWYDRAAAENTIRGGAVEIAQGFEKLQAKLELEAAMNQNQS